MMKFAKLSGIEFYTQTMIESYIISIIETIKKIILI